ncbi:MAG: ParB/RepB/Spo0J family partition protein [Oscillospiraceae bacterium]|nr:ParB/RepB/Spo0J family partition protein [Oscillospiraceae bacterium]
MALKKSGLGKGLDALFADNSSEGGSSAVKLRITEIEPNKEQPRKEFDQEALARLSESIAAHGIIQPILVRPNTNGTYQIVAGERRWRAANMAGLSEIPVLIRELNDREVSELALIENLQREDLNPIEEAEGYRNLMENYGMTQENLSETIGRSRTAIANVLRLLHLPKEVLDIVKSGDLTGSQARSLLAFKTKEKMIEMAKLAAEQGLTVRKLEELAKKEENVPRETTSASTVQRESYYDEVEIALKEHLGRKVQVQNKKGGKGMLLIEFYNQDDLKNLANLLDTE